MNLESLQPLANHLWQSTVFAAFAGLLTLMLRTNRARVRHAVWLAASCKFLIPISALIAFGGLFQLRTSHIAMPPGISVVVSKISQPLTGPIFASPVTASQPTATPLPATLCAVWFCGFIGITFSWWIRWRRVAALVRLGSPAELDAPIRAISTPANLEPAVFGVFRPVLLLPEGVVKSLPPAQLKAVIAHELCHVRNRDNLVAAFQMFVETVFWFYPPVWWIGKRMAAERERACDEEVLRLGNDPGVYAESILRVCALSAESPLACLSGVTGPDLKKRIQAIVAARREVELSFARKALLAVLGISFIVLPFLIGVWNAAPLRGENEVSVPISTLSGAKFRAVAIERCVGNHWGQIGSPAPGKLLANCVTVSRLIYTAWLSSAVASLGAAQSTTLLGDPEWISSGNYLYRIDARADPGVNLAAMEGPMLQSLLADRFGLKLRRVTRESPIYALKVAKGGAKLAPTKAGTCSIGVFYGNGRVPPPPPPGGDSCSSSHPVMGTFHSERLEGHAIGIDEFCRLLASPLGRPVINRTGISGRFDFHLAFAGDETPGALGPLYPSLFKAVEEQLGLELEPTTGPLSFLLIDQVKKPLPE